MSDKRGMDTDEPILFRVLGPLEVACAGGPVTISAAKQRIALATMLLSPNLYVSHDRLIERIWDDTEPNNARGALYTLITRLRHALGASAERPLIRTHSDGYVIGIQPDQVDLLRFRDLTKQAAATTDAAREANLLGHALALWQRPLLANVPSESLHRYDVPILMEERLTATERLVQLRLQRGRHNEMIVVLREATADYPFREHLWAQLMVALHRSGRRAEALETYRTVVALLRDDLGVDPAHHLVRAHAEILAGDSVQLPHDVDEPSSADGPQVRRIRPQQLPADLARFTGRAAALARLDEMLCSTEEMRPQPTMLAVVGGAAGVGKTTLAVHWAHRIRDRFPDGQLYLNLRASGPEARVEPAIALEMLLRSLDVPAHRIPDELEARSALLRSTLTGKRVLILLDNADDAAQVRPLLPSSASLVLVTSRSRLSGLAAVDGARQVILDQLDADESLALLGKLLGANRVAAEPGAAAELARLSGHLPLALVIIAHHADQRPDATLADLVGQFSDNRTRLDLLDLGDDPNASLRAAFCHSYRALEPPAARAFRRLGLHNGSDIGLAEAAALLGTSQAQARQLADLLTSRCLLEPVGRDRYRFHDLVRIYAAERAVAEECEEVRLITKRRELSWHPHTADSVLNPEHQRLRLLPAAPDVQPRTFGICHEALEWWEAKRVSLRTATRQATEIEENTPRGSDPAHTEDCCICRCTGTTG